MSEEPNRKPPLPARVKRESPSPASSPARGEGRIKPSKNRLLQATRRPKRKLFDAARRAIFLEVFAATCNVRLAAAKAEICYGTVFRHRMKDAEFAAAWDAALAQGYAYLEARLLEEARYSPAVSRAASGSLRERPSDSLREPPPRPAVPDREDLLGFDPEEHFDPELALTLLREHARRLPGSGTRGSGSGTR